MPFRDRSAIVGGAGSTLGAAVARALVAAGARVVAETETEGGPIDLLVDATPLPLASGPLAGGDFDAEGHLAAARPLAWAARLAPRVPPGGAVLLIAAIPSGAAPSGWLLAHLAWRAAVVAALARELAPGGVRVNALAPAADEARLPGFLRPAAGTAPAPLPRTARPEDVAGAALWLLGPGAGTVTGLTLPLDGGRGL